MKDFRGQELKPGDKIAHARRFSSSLWLQEATILEIKPRKAAYRGDGEECAVILKADGTRSTLKVADYIAKLNG